MRLAESFIRNAAVQNGVRLDGQYLKRKKSKQNRKPDNKESCTQLSYLLRMSNKTKQTATKISRSSTPVHFLLLILCRV